MELCAELNIAGHSVEEIVKNIKTLNGAGYDDTAAMHISLTIARAAYKTAYPDRGLPEHLSGGCKEAIKAARGGEQK